ncbi:hypothetical protein DZC78_04760 [Olleya aquimaris]|nr:hypothetical protein DZC78_04760 [Olleya aquimaris]
MESLRNNKMYNLLSGLLLIGFGCFRLYQHFNTKLTLNNLKLAIAVFAIVYGIYSLYKYTQLKKQE